MSKNKVFTITRKEDYKVKTAISYSSDTKSGLITNQIICTYFSYGAFHESSGISLDLYSHEAKKVGDTSDLMVIKTLLEADAIKLRPHINYSDCSNHLNLDEAKAKKKVNSSKFHLCQLIEAATSPSFENLSRNEYDAEMALIKEAKNEYVNSLIIFTTSIR